ncbi:hypothetical protein RHSIM_RhsimUnG0045700 [Rhododendron simsii]|uniref:Protein kinase domain-containing protein n=1 Tax=Rhododendron simsii TaxID=118357 RepID=A0A834FVR8_RHOSS|nr:hypothetical protein RHSIM_RhsimUnG0045700 [Rhododendron simsii]
MVEEKKRQFMYSELMTITNNFEELLGKGAFESVYAGHLTDDTKDTKVVAVKMLSLSSTHEGSKQFRDGSIVVFCNKIPFKLTQYNIEFAALEYLHDGCKPLIIHRDIKPANILLTENMQAKVSDFGLSRLMPYDMPSDGGTHVSISVVGTREYIVGTPGYMDPEFIASSKLNEKSNVYGFGVVLLELITRKPAVLKTPENTHLVKWIVSMVERAQIKEIMDSRLNSDFDTNSAWKALETAMPCVELNSNRRLEMRQVVVNLRECLEMEKASVRAWKENEEHNFASGNTDYAMSESLVGGPFARWIKSSL